MLYSSIRIQVSFHQVTDLRTGAEMACWRRLSCRLHQRPQSKFLLLILSAVFDTVAHSAINLSRGPDWNKESHSRRAAVTPMMRSQKMTELLILPKWLHLWGCTEIGLAPHVLNRPIRPLGGTGRCHAI